MFCNFYRMNGITDHDWMKSKAAMANPAKFVDTVTGCDYDHLTGP